MLEGQAAPLPYQSELAVIMAAIDQMKQRDIVNNINPNNLQHVISDMKHAELSAALATLETTRPVPPQQKEARPPETAPMLLATMLDDRLSDDGNRLAQQLTAELLPAEPPQTITTAPLNQTPTATQALRDFLVRHPRSIDWSNDDDDNHLHDESR